MLLGLAQGRPPVLTVLVTRSGACLLGRCSAAAGWTLTVLSAGPAPQQLLQGEDLWLDFRSGDIISVASSSFCLTSIPRNLACLQESGSLPSFPASGRELASLQKELTWTCRPGLALIVSLTSHCLLGTDVSRHSVS